MKHFLLCLCCLAAITPAAATENEVIPGEWLSNEYGIFITPDAEASEPIFLYGNCAHTGARGQAEAQLNLDVEHKWIGPIIGKGDYIIAHFIGTGSALDLVAASVWNNEASSRTSWTTRFEHVSRQNLEYLVKSKSLSLAVGDRQGNYGVRYTLPEKNRATALNAFINGCFGGA